MLENGDCFNGHSPKWQQDFCKGEVVFTTGMTGYPESMTDPSYAGQILTFTYPLIGNYGVPNPSEWESDQIHLQGIITSELCLKWSHHLGIFAIEEWLHKQKKALITGVDTRRLTKVLRTFGTMRGIITTQPYSEVLPEEKRHFVAEVSTQEIKRYGSGVKRIIAVDCGMKENILRELCKFPVSVLRVPYNYDYTEEKYDGVFLSNGPGDPVCCSETIRILQKAMQHNQRPIFGICLGAQLMALAAQGRTYKLPYGHRGQNQPCIELSTKKCFITSQNHGYAIDEASLPGDWTVTFKNLNDGSVEGIAHYNKPYFAVQFHPEAFPGPTDTRWLFEQFYRSL